MSEQAAETPITPEGAAQALFDAVQADNGRDSPGVPGPGAQPGESQNLTAFDVHAPGNQPPTAAPPQVEGTAPTAEQSPGEIADEEGLLSKDIDLAHLDPAAREWLTAREREMQSVMTRRTQEAAEIQKQYEGLDPATAREALGFYEGIRSDPNYAAEVYDLLTQNLISAGYAPARAAYEAANQLNGGQQQTPQAEAPSYEEDPEAAIQARLDELDQRQAQIDEQFRAAQMQRMEDELANQILTQENAIRQARPDLKDEHIDTIYDLSPTGDLMSGYQKFTQLQQQLIGDYLAQKGSIPDAVSPPAAAPMGKPPLSFHDAAGNPDIEAAHRAALETLRGEMSQQ